MHYGLTEASRSTFLDFKDSKNLGSVGKPIKGVEIKIVDDDFKLVKCNQEGRIGIKSDWMATNYLNKHTNKNFRNGWLITDDIGYLDDSGYLYFVSRKTDIINLGGYKFAPQEVERILDKVEGIKKSCVVISNDTDPKLVSFFECEDGCLVSSRKLKEICKRNLENYKIPKIFINADKIEMTDTGKIKRNLMVNKIGK